ncbi:hypothetical protein Aduo_012617 [Ancylostoma duodenale]
MVFNGEVTKKRVETFQENVNKKTSIDWMRISGSTSPRKRKLNRLLQDFARDILRLSTIRARTSYHFWRFFMTEGRENFCNALCHYSSGYCTEAEVNTISQLESSLGFGKQYKSALLDKAIPMLTLVSERLPTGTLFTGLNKTMAPVREPVIIDVVLC